MADEHGVFEVQLGSHAVRGALPDSSGNGLYRACYEATVAGAYSLSILVASYYINPWHTLARIPPDHLVPGSPFSPTILPRPVSDNNAAGRMRLML